MERGSSHLCDKLAEKGFPIAKISAKTLISETSTFILLSKSGLWVYETSKFTALDLITFQLSNGNGNEFI